MIANEIVPVVTRPGLTLGQEVLSEYEDEPGPPIQLGSQSSRYSISVSGRKLA